MTTQTSGTAPAPPTTLPPEAQEFPADRRRPRMTGRVVFVTGGTRGIGAAISRSFAEQGAVVACGYGRDTEHANKLLAQLRDHGVQATVHQGNVGSADDCRRTIGEVLEAHGRLDVLVNNAGIFPFGPIDDVTLEEVDRTLGIHARAAYLASQAAIRHMTEGGRIISIGSNLAERVPFPGVALYSMSKSALLGFTRGLARDLGERGITVNLVQPGSTDTEMNPADGPAADHQRAISALGRYADPADIADTVAFLSGPGGRNITGSVFTVDGGTNA
jgi:3-oxoacyl-[acyl-carrier protein] reductase